MPVPNDPYALRRTHCPGCGVFYNGMNIGPREPVIEAFPGVYYAQCPHCKLRWHVHRPGAPERDLADLFVAERPDEQPDIAAAWTGAVLRLTLDDHILRVGPAVGGPDTDEIPHPLGEVAHVLTGWNPGGLPGRLAHNLDAHRRLLDDLHERGLRLRTDAACHHPEFAWAEQSMVAVGAQESLVLEVARRFGQPAVLRWTAGLLTPIGTHTGEPLADGDPVVVTRLPRRPCVMTGEARDEVCRNPGGPWISRSRAVGTDWNDRRTCLYTALGCDTCHGARAAGIAGAAARVVFIRPSVPSRYGLARRTTVTGP
ncbi:DUF3293 domain-containing protein [Microbispora sp. H10836]|uniref:DUF3293 domain-containing protein n=1 Tax=Microbispora sp. H10836 TaxID=2729106 RepID=UPI00147327EC|nr:DUF3293 domain-containing protein [Microbispora sp. H10836]